MGTRRFPGARVLLEADNKVGYKHEYVPSFFASEPFGATTAHPTQSQADEGVEALKGNKRRQFGINVANF